MKSFRYFDKLFKVDAPDMYEDVKAYRLSTLDVFNEANFSGYDEEDFYNVVETNQKAERTFRDFI